MADIKPPTIPLSIPSPTYLADHRAEGRSILPAVEALQYLARAVREAKPATEVWRSRLAEFVRFLPLPKNQASVEAEVELEEGSQGSMTARLLSRVRMGKTGITRTRLHVEVEFGRTQPLELPPWDMLACLQGLCCTFDAAKLYRTLVPFGQSYHNVIGQVHLAESGAVGRIRAATLPAPMDPLGNPFVLDAAFHLACAWGQRYAQVLTFPTGFTERVIQQPCRSGEDYLCRVVPVSVEDDLLLFDLYLFDENGGLCEACLGVKFQDVAAGRMPPADWVKHPGVDPFEELRARCAGLAIVELDTLSPFYQKAYTARERGRDLEMGAKRSRSFAGARLALKALARQIAQDLTSPGDVLQTVSDDRIHPLLPLPEGDAIRFCAAAHDDRFAVAVGADHPIGVDVEKISDRVLTARRIYLNSAEQELVDDSPMGAVQAALRCWTVKEAAAKALDIPLAKAFSRVQLESLGPVSCLANLDGRHTEARCIQVGEHLFTLVGFEEDSPIRP